MPLDTASILALTAKERPYKVADAGGLYLLVAPTGGKWWRLKYRFERKEKGLSLGVFPEVSLSAARQQRDEARALLRLGIDPSAARQAAKSDNPKPSRQPTFHLSLSADGGLSISKRHKKLILTPEQTLALKVFLQIPPQTLGEPC